MAAKDHFSGIDVSDPVGFVTRSRHGDKGRDIAAQLASAIRAGRYVPGERLVEARLTRQLGVSRGPLREAFRRLSAEGLVETVPNRGALVRRLTLAEALELFDIRMELESLAARRAADNMSERSARDLFDLESAEIWLDTPRVSAASYIAENQQFHRAVFNGAGNHQLMALNDKLQLSLIMVQIRSALTPDVLATSLSEHRQIATAIRDGDAPAAGIAMCTHLNRAVALVRSMSAEMFRGG